MKKKHTRTRFQPSSAGPKAGPIWHKNLKHGDSAFFVPGYACVFRFFFANAASRARTQRDLANKARDDAIKRVAELEAQLRATGQQTASAPNYAATARGTPAARVPATRPSSFSQQNPMGPEEGTEWETESQQRDGRDEDDEEERSSVEEDHDDPGESGSSPSEGRPRLHRVLFIFMFQYTGNRPRQD